MADTGSDEGLGERLLEMERELWNGGAEAYRRHLDDACLTVFAQMAGRWSRDEIAGMVEDEPRWTDLRMDVVGLVRPSDDVAIVAYRAQANRGEERYHALVSSGWVRRDEEWKMLFHQQTAAQPDSGETTAAA